MKRTILLLLIAGLATLTACSGASKPSPQQRFIPDKKPTLDVHWGERVTLGSDYALTLWEPTSAAATYGTSSELVWYEMQALVEVTGTKEISYIPMSAQDGNGDSIEVIDLIELPLQPGQTRRAQVTIKSHGSIDNAITFLLYDNVNEFRWTYQL